MSALESLIWYAIGYASMPVIFIVGFALVAVASCMVLDQTGHKIIERE